MGKTQGTQTVTQQTKLPAWYETAAKDAIKRSTQAADTLAQPYMGNQVADMDPLTQQAIGLTGGNIGSTNAAYGAAQQGATGVMNYDPSMVSGGSFLTGNIGAYMNPFIQNVEEQALGNLDRAYRQNLNTIGDSAINAGAFGGSRQGVAEGVAAAENARQMGDLSAQLRSQGFTQGAGMMESDMARALAAGQSNQQAGLQGAQLNLAGAGQLGELASQGQQAYLQSLQSALAAGQINQQQAQALLTQQAAQYDAMRNYPQEQLNILLAALGGTQVPTSTSTTSPTSGNWLTGALGGAMAGAELGPLGIIGGGLLGGFAGR